MSHPRPDEQSLDVDPIAAPFSIAPSAAGAPSAAAPRSAAADPRTAAERAADHAEIERLATELLPALTAKLGATGLGEIEVREGARRIRIRQPADALERGRPGRSGDRAARGTAAHPGHGPAGAPGTAHGAAAGAVSSSGAPTTNGTAPDADLHRAVATSPAVGIFQPGSSARAGTRVRAGDRLGNVDMLGVPNEVVAPTDGIVGATLVDAGEAVEYGQELIRIELAGATSGTDHG